MSQVIDLLRKRAALVFFGLHCLLRVDFLAVFRIYETYVPFGRNWRFTYGGKAKATLHYCTSG